MKTSFYFFFLTILTVQLYGQNTLITLKGDTLDGTFTIRKSSGQEFIDFKNQNGKRKKVKLLEIKRILTADNEIIEPIKLSDRYTFGKLITSGYLRLYKYKGTNSNIDFNESVLIKLDGSSLVVPGAVGFRRAMGNFLTECDVVNQKIKDRAYDPGDLETIIKEFNTCIQESSSKSFSTPAISSTEVDDDFKAKIADFKTLLKYSDKVSNKEDVSDMFNDLVKKIEGKENVPRYLKNLITSSVSEDEKLKKLLEDILN